MFDLDSFVVPDMDNLKKKLSVYISNVKRL